MNALTIGIDVAKEFHWVVAIVPHPETGEARHEGALGSTPASIAAWCLGAPGWDRLDLGRTPTKGAAVAAWSREAVRARSAGSRATPVR